MQLWSRNAGVRGNIEKVKVKLLSRVQLFATPWTVAHQAPPSMHIKTIVRCHLTLVIIKISTNNKCWREYGEKETLLHCWLECKLVQPLWRTVWRFLKKLRIELHMSQKSYFWAYTWRKPELKETHVPQCSLQHSL